MSVRVPSGLGLVLGINGTPLMQMTVFSADGQVEAERGPLRVVQLSAAAGSPVQVLVTNEGVASGLLTMSCRADRIVIPPSPSVIQPIPVPVPGLVPRPMPPSTTNPELDPNPIPDSATGDPMEPESDVQDLAPAEDPWFMDDSVVDED